jgi:carboxymethylenebutenolidase
MGETIQLRAADGHTLDAYVARPADVAAGALVVIQEIFGVNRHIRDVADGYARDGFLVVAPALFDRVEKNVQLGYEGEDRQRAMSFFHKLDFPSAMKDIDAALAWAREDSGGKTGVVGYCVGGTLAWLSAAQLAPDAAVGYYPGGIDRFTDETPTCRVMLHFGKLDKHIPKEMVETVGNAHPEVQVFWYDADHGFNRDAGASYQAEASKLARKRSLALFNESLRK